MKKILTLLLIMFAAIGLLFITVSTAQTQSETKEKRSTDTGISILNYSLKPVGYVNNNKFISSNYQLELKNNERTAKNVKYTIMFYDKNQNTVKEVKKEINLNGKETKKYSDDVLLDSGTAKKITATEAIVEIIK
jgi:hypothetical protein